MEVARPEVDHPAPARVRDIGIGDVPLARDRPVEDARPARNLPDLERHLFSDAEEGLPEAVAGDAPADRVQLLHEAVHRLADPGFGCRPLCLHRIHPQCIRICQSYGISLSNGSRRVVRAGSCGCVAQFAMIANGRLMPLNPVQIPGGITTSE